MALGYDPIRTLMDEHQVFLSRVEAMRHAWRSGNRASDRSTLLPRRVAEFSKFLARDVDELHARKEEQALFPVLGKHLPREGGPVEVMVSEHDTMRAFQNTLERSGAALASDPENDRAFTSIGRVLGDVDSLLSQHIVKEDFVLFPTAQELLSRSELLDIAEKCQEIEQAYQERYGTSPLLMAMGPELAALPARGAVRP